MRRARVWPINCCQTLHRSLEGPPTRAKPLSNQPSKPLSQKWPLLPPTTPHDDFSIYAVLVRRYHQTAPCNGSYLWINEHNFNQFLQMKMLITLHFLPTWKHAYTHTPLLQTQCILDNENKQKIPSNIFFDTFYIFAETVIASWYLPTYV